MGNSLATRRRTGRRGPVLKRRAASRERAGAPVRARVRILGAVQGVGFRPAVFRLATELGLAGWVRNSAQGVIVEIEGAAALAREFILRIESEKPPRSFIQSMETTWLAAAGHREFSIRQSDDEGPKSALILPDIAVCPECLAEIFDSANRRYLYPFTNCTHCGPRFSIVEALPYDRPNTSMRDFQMCPDCLREYGDPRDRRFHAQPNACPKCGPHLELWDDQGGLMHSRREALTAAANAIREGEIVAVKGVGGFHLVVDARDDDAVRRLRERKHREEKPFALMMPSLDAIRAECEVSDLEARLLRSPEAPITLLRRRADHDSAIALSVAPGNPTLGVMLPYSPLHHLLMTKLGFPIVATSGNISDEPICTDEREAVKRLRGIASYFLVHNRRIVRHMDDSVVRIVLGRELVLRRARGYAPLPIRLKQRGAAMLAVGGHLKNTVAICAGDNVILSQHIGDLETERAFAAFRGTVRDLQKLYEIQPRVIAMDAHPDYLSAKFAARLRADSGCTLLPVQHHFAHVLACMAENEIEPPALGVAWDGTGYGFDGTIWGGEFLAVAPGADFQRVAHFRTFALPGGEAAVREPRRCAIGVLRELYGESAFDMELGSVRAFSPAELRALRVMLKRNVNTPRTSSAGRLFDAVASLAGVRQRMAFEGEAAMELEFAAKDRDAESYPFELAGPMCDWAPMIRAIVEDARAGATPAMISSKFHRTLAEMIVAVAMRAAQPNVVLTGGCFQNELLLTLAVTQLRKAGFNPIWHQRIPPHDGGIALGQIVACREAQNAVSTTARNP